MGIVYGIGLTNISQLELIHQYDDNPVIHWNLGVA